MPDYYPTSTHYASGGVEAWTTPAGTLHEAIDEIGAHNGDTDYITQASIFAGWGDTPPLFVSVVILRLSETPLPIADPTDLTGAILKIQARLAEVNLDLGWNMKVYIGLGEPEEELYIGSKIFYQADLTTAYTELQVPVNDAVLPGLTPSSLKAYAALYIWHA